MTTRPGRCGTRAAAARLTVIAVLAIGVATVLPARASAQWDGSLTTSAWSDSAGGWFEWRFGDCFVEARFVPKTFNEYTQNHQHGTRLVATALDGSGALYSVFDSAGGYYQQSEIKLQRDRKYALVIEIADRLGLVDKLDLGTAGC